MSRRHCLPRTLLAVGGPSCPKQTLCSVARVRAVTYAKVTVDQAELAEQRLVIERRRSACNCVGMSDELQEARLPCQGVFGIRCV